ncbi:MAG TPA: right-handed parallel beta-helix repeat-containing protein [Flavipsychrobacter sp.]|nr:right-handed parallel beta-helix repeat-containing protein [Flavipsychrobacter sp.]
MRKIGLLFMMWAIAFQAAYCQAQTIVNDPEVISEGIWFVIQNKSDVDLDIITTPAVRKALKINNSGVAVMDVIPMDSATNYDEFLWRTNVLPGGKYQLINKKEGSSKALSSAGNTLAMASITTATDQEWFLAKTNLALHGTNVYELNTTATTAANAFELSGTSIVVNTKNTSNTNQCWVFQPVELVAGYTMPTAPTDITGVSYRTLTDTQYAIKIAATPSTSDWALLNTHLIYKNMLNSLLPSVASAFDSHPFQRMSLIISKGDPNLITSTTPYLHGAGYTTTQMTQLRGGVIFNNSTAYIIVTEEMMCKVGVFNRPSDNTYREFDQVVHEFTHAIDALGGLNTTNSSSNPYPSNKSEWFPWITQQWFNSQFSNTQGESRADMTPSDYNYVNSIFNSSNTWLPARNFRGVDPYECAPATVYVNQAISTSGDGRTWSSAFKTLEEALTLANSCDSVLEIRVAGGTYYPTNVYNSSDPRDAVFAITRSSLRVIGGYNASTGKRSFTANPTYLSGNVGLLNQSTDNAYHVMVIGGINSANTDSIIVDGFIIQDGYANGSGGLGVNGTTFYRNNGGGLHTNGAHSRTLIKNCVFTQNAGLDGSTFSIQHSANPSFVNCLLTGNQIVSGSIGYTVLTYNSYPRFINTTIANNTTGGGIIGLASSAPTIISNSIVWSNNGTSLNGSFDVSYSNIESGSVQTGTGNINTSPTFKNTSNAVGADNIWGSADDGFHLAVGSPSINTGRNDSIPNGISTDLTGAVRIYGANADMGAYEYNPCSGFQTLYVDSSITASGLGTTWATAYKTLDEALDKAWSCTTVERILVAQGTYAPQSYFYAWQSDGTGVEMAPFGNNRYKTFHVRQGLELYGGYPTGGGTRDFRTHTTILSGAGVGGVATDSAYHILYTDTSTYWTGGYNDTTIVDGFTIRNGVGNLFTNYTINGNTFIRNDVGTGMRNEDGNIIVRNNIFSNNRNVYTGGGLYSGLNSSSVIINNVFYSNSGSAGGGGCYLSGVSTIVNNIFYNNAAGNNGGAIFTNGANKTFSLVNNTFVKNVATNSGGGCYMQVGTNYFSNNIFFGNSASLFGQDIYKVVGTATYYADFNLLQTTLTIGSGVGSHNIFGENPAFADTSDADGPDNIFRTTDDGLQLTVSSPAVSGGSNDSIPSGIATDFMGANRIQRNIVDMGAYESSFGASWTGATSADWNTASNWFDNIVPIPNSVIHIPATGVTNEPTLATNETHKRLIISQGRTLTINSGNIISINQGFTNNGTTTGDGKILLTGGTSTIAIGGIGTTNHIELNNNTGAAINAGAADQLNVTNSLTITSGTLTTNSNLVLKSTASNTARVAPFVTGSPIIGNVVVERYIGAPSARRAWRLLTAPLTGNTGANGLMSVNWQNDFDGDNNTVTPGVGTNITGPNPITGADFISADYSLKKYNVTNQKLDSVTNISTETLFNNSASIANKAFFIFVRGDKTTGTFGTSNTVLKAVGQLQRGQQQFNQATLPANRFWAVGNPYASPVDFGLITRNNIGKRFWVWDPNLNTVGGYVLVDDAGNTGTYTYTPSTGSSQNHHIQSGQAFFVRTVSSGTSGLTFQEAHKSTGTVNNVFKTTSTIESLNGVLYGLDASNNATVFDGFTLQRDANFSDTIDDLDAPKMQNVNENIGIYTDSTRLSIERKSLIGTNNDTVQLKFNNTRLMNYKISLQPNNYSTSQTIFLRDAYLNTLTPVSTTGTTDYNFTITTATGSWDQFRFSLVFMGNAPLSLNKITFQGGLRESVADLQWINQQEKDVLSYELEKSTDGKSFTSIHKLNAKYNHSTAATYNYEDAEATHKIQYYRIKALKVENEYIYSHTISLANASITNKASLSVFPNPVENYQVNLKLTNLTRGMYYVKITAMDGKVVYKKEIEHNGQNDIYLITLPALASTLYQLEFSSENELFKEVKTIRVQ